LPRQDAAPKENQCGRSRSIFVTALVQERGTKLGRSVNLYLNQGQVENAFSTTALPTPPQNPRRRKRPRQKRPQVTTSVRGETSFPCLVMVRKQETGSFQNVTNVRNHNQTLVHASPALSGGKRVACDTRRQVRTRILQLGDERAGVEKEGEKNGAMDRKLGTGGDIRALRLELWCRVQASVATVYEISRAGDAGNGDPQGGSSRALEWLGPTFEARE